MNSSTIPILVALFVQLALGLVVFQANRQLKSNQSFLLLSAVAAGWLCSLYYASAATNPEMAAFWIREASALGALNLAGFNLLRLSIREKQRDWKEILRQSRVWIIATAAIVIFCQTKFFLSGAHSPAPASSNPPILKRDLPVPGRVASHNRSLPDKFSLRAPGRVRDLQGQTFRRLPKSLRYRVRYQMAGSLFRVRRFYKNSIRSR